MEIFISLLPCSFSHSRVRRNHFLASIMQLLWHLPSEAGRQSYLPVLNWCRRSLKLMGCANRKSGKWRRGSWGPTLTGLGDAVKLMPGMGAERNWSCDWKNPTKGWLKVATHVRPSMDVKVSFGRAKHWAKFKLSTSRVGSQTFRLCSKASARDRWPGIFSRKPECRLTSCFSSKTSDPDIRLIRWVSSL